MNKTVEIIKAISGLMKTLLDGFGVVEAVVLVIIVGVLAAILAPDALEASLKWLSGLLPSVVNAGG